MSKKAIVAVLLSLFILFAYVGARSSVKNTRAHLREIKTLYKVNGDRAGRVYIYKSSNKGSSTPYFYLFYRYSNTTDTYDYSTPQFEVDWEYYNYN